MEKHKVASLNELQTDGSRVITTIKGKEISIFRIDGEYHAVANYCPHQSGPLCEGKLTGHMTSGEDGWELEYDKEGKIIRCPWHSWRFDVATGSNIQAEKYKVPTFDVTVEEEDIYVKI